MSELMIAVALWCGQVLVQPHGMYIKPQATTAQVDQCRRDILNCVDKFQNHPPSNIQYPADPMISCFQDQKLPGGKQ